VSNARQPVGHDTLRLYGDLAWLWPLWGDHETEYADFCHHVARLLREHALRPVESVLVSSCGSGKNVFNLKREFAVTGLDISPAMLALAAELNPECEFVQGDMRDFSLEQRFDAVLIDDGVSHLLSRDDLAAAFRAAYRHLRPGGVMLATPDITRESFRQNRTSVEYAGGSAKPPNVEVVFVENVFDPDPDDEHVEVTYVYLVREEGRLRIETDGCRLGLFSVDTWRACLLEAGFQVREARYRQGEDDYLNFICSVPVDAGPGSPSPHQ
jgi:SAM-dependent methyltransferase